MLVAAYSNVVFLTHKAFERAECAVSNHFEIRDFARLERQARHSGDSFEQRFALDARKLTIDEPPAMCCYRFH